MKGKTHTYYQVLIDARDCPHIVSVSRSIWALLVQAEEGGGLQTGWTGGGVGRARASFCSSAF